jgi:hypothetical protein
MLKRYLCVIGVIPKRNETIRDITRMSNMVLNFKDNKIVQEIGLFKEKMI